MLKSFTIESDLAIQSTGAIEVIVEMQDGQRRWCYFLTPQALTACGDWINGTRIRIHYAAPYMIVVAAPLDEKIIKQALCHIDRDGKLEVCTMPMHGKQAAIKTPLEEM